MLSGKVRQDDDAWMSDIECLPDEARRRSGLLLLTAHHRTNKRYHSNQRNVGRITFGKEGHLKPSVLRRLDVVP